MANYMYSRETRKQKPKLLGNEANKWGWGGKQWNQDPTGSVCLVSYMILFCKKGNKKDTETADLRFDIMLLYGTEQPAAASP